MPCTTILYHTHRGYASKPAVIGLVFRWEGEGRGALPHLKDSGAQQGKELDFCVALLGAIGKLAVSARALPRGLYPVPEEPQVAVQAIAAAHA